jgi:hypothetical protein
MSIIFHSLRTPAISLVVIAKLERPVSCRLRGLKVAGGVGSTNCRSGPGPSVVAWAACRFGVPIALVIVVSVKIPG